MLFLQLKNGELEAEPLSASLVHSVAAVTSQASVTTVTITSGSNSICNENRFSPGKFTAIPYIPAQQQASSSHQETALKYFSMTQSGDPGHPEQEPNSSPVPQTLSIELKRQGEAAEEGRREQHQDEEGDRGRQQGGAREDSQDSSTKGNRQQHPQPQQSSWSGESEPLPSQRGTYGVSQERGGYLREASSKQEQERSNDQAGISGRILL